MKPNERPELPLPAPPVTDPTSTRITISDPAKEAAIERLAEALNWKMEHLDPTTDPMWNDGLDERSKEFYRLCVKWLLVHSADDLKIALDSL